MKFFWLGILLKVLLCAGNDDPGLKFLCNDEMIKGPQGDYLFISTIDGSISAFDVRNNGKLKWTMKTGTPLISSNIHNLDLTESGKFVRMIPSLSGGIYKFDGDEIDTVPITTEDLLNSSHKFSDDLVVSGGKDKVVFGISKNSGNILYECSMQGCLNATKTDAIKPKDKDEIETYDKTDNEDVLVITKETQTIRAIEARTGQERWNYSVGRLELEVVKAVDCTQTEIQTTDEDDWEIDIKVSVSDGIIWVFKKNEPSSLLWKYKFEHPIVSIWTTNKDKLKPVDLFNSSSWRWNNIKEDGPSLYIGMYQKQLYIQESDELRRSLSTSFFQMKRYLHDTLTEQNGNQVQDLLPKFSWESMVINNEYLLGEPDEDEAANSALVPIDSDNKQIAAKSILYSSEYVNGHGFFLYSNTKPDSKSNKICSSNDSTENNNTILPPEMDSNSFVLIYLWWREISVFLVTLVAARLLWSYSILQREKEIVVIERRIPVPTAVEAIETITVEGSKSNNNNSSEKSMISFESTNGSFDFSSRFEGDFEFVQCLGKGGFGVVFEAKNKLDDCNYAVKRITLPNKKESRDRVLREVKTLANCEHGNIVRYYNAWVEKPPNGWQEEKDVKWIQTLKNTLFESETNCNYSTSNEYTSNVHASYSKTTKSSVSIDMHLNENNSLDCTNLSNSFEIEFVDSTEEQVTVSSMNLSNHSVVEPRAPAPAQSKVYLYIQMQLCEKKSLHDWLRENVLQQRYCNRNTFSIFEQIVDAVEYVHKKNLIHRDLKPSNIFFSLDGKIKIGDFGLVTDMSDIPNLILACGDKTGLPQCGIHTQLVGTHLYMSPEQLKGQAYDYKVDIFSLGLILFELLVYFDTEMERVVTLKNARDTKFSKEFLKQFPKEGTLLHSMLAENPNSRPTATELKERINRLQKEGF